MSLKGKGDKKEGKWIERTVGARTARRDDTMQVLFRSIHVYEIRAVFIAVFISKFQGKDG